MRLALFIVVLALVLTPSASATHWLANANIHAEATSPAGANVGFPVAAGSTCSPAPNSLFPIGSTRVTCTDDSNPSIEVNSFNVIVEDTTTRKVPDGGVQLVVMAFGDRPLGEGERAWRMRSGSFAVFAAQDEK